MKFKTLLLLSLAAILSLHLFKIDQIGKGLYVDESSIGYNAITISRTLRDEHGYFLPLYFKAFGEYKNPLYIYATALLFKIAGISVFNLRLTSALFFFVALWLAGTYVLRLFKENNSILLYFILTLGFLPVYFSASRVSFEVISQLTLMSAFLLFLYLGYSTKDWKYPLLCGATLGISVYTYTTSRLLTFLFFGLTFIFFRKNLGKSFYLGFLVSTLPYLIYLLLYPDHVINLRLISLIKLNTDTMTVADRISLFASNYIKALSPVFLAFNGDPNYRHSTSFTGVVFIVNLILFIPGLVYVLLKKYKFGLYMFVLLLVSNIGAPLTGEPYHTFRNFLVGLFISVISCYGILVIQSIRSRPRRGLLTAIVFIILIGEIVNFQYNYFINYPQISIAAFESSGYVDAFKLAREQSPTKIVISEETDQPYIHHAFNNQIIDLSQGIQVQTGPLRPENGVCILFIPDNKQKLDFLSKTYNYKDFTRSDWFYTVRCFIFQT